MKMLTLWACIEPIERPGESGTTSTLTWMEAWKMSCGERVGSAKAASPDEKMALRHPGT
ncbi:MAG: hypothetical protein JNM45_03990 [Rhizobiales bacterium]|nr:hypothetical protein [Hyphomicrobiales bacterium]